MSERLAVVTGGGTGIGLACARRLGEEGNRVALVGRRVEVLEDAVVQLRSEGIRVEGIPCDVTDEASVEKLFEAVGPADILVNNAGVSSAARVEKTTLADWHLNMAVNATGPFLCSRAALPAMRERGWGRIVTIASMAAVAGFPRLAAYAASKHAAIGLVRVLAAELAGTPVTANAICPSYVRTPMTDRTVSAITERTGRQREDTEEVLARQSLLGRLIEPVEVAAAVSFFCSEEGASLNGQILVMDGGGSRS